MLCFHKDRLNFSDNSLSKYCVFSGVYVVPDIELLLSSILFCQQVVGTEKQLLILLCDLSLFTWPLVIIGGIRCKVKEGVKISYSPKLYPNPIGTEAITWP